MNLKLHLVLFALLAFGCEDPRPTQREGHIFDPGNAFIRFNYDNRVNEPARDSLLLSRLELDTFEIPIALSAAPQEQPVEVIEQQVTITRPSSSGLPPFEIGISGGGTYDEASGIISLDVYFDETAIGGANNVLRKYVYEKERRE